MLERENAVGERFARLFFVSFGLKLFDEVQATDGFPWSGDAGTVYQHTAAGRGQIGECRNSDGAGQRCRTGRSGDEQSEREHHHGSHEYLGEWTSLN
jgi:hypothetical protein